MARAKNHVIYDQDQTKLERLYGEYVNYVGREAKLRRGVLTIFALPRRARRNER